MRFILKRAVIYAGHLVSPVFRCDSDFCFGAILIHSPQVCIAVIGYAVIQTGCAVVCFCGQVYGQGAVGADDCGKITADIPIFA